MVLPTPFTTTTPVIANYDYTDVANAVGYEIYKLTNSTGAEWRLDKNVTMASTKSLDNGANANFSSTVFTMPRTIKGTAFFEQSIYINASGTTRTITVDAVLKLVSGVTVTTIATFPQTSNGSGAAVYLNDLAAVDIAETIVKVGDYLRLDVDLGGYVTLDQVLFTDPGASTVGQIGITKVNIPFKLDF